jgi:hypothetical protein
MIKHNAVRNRTFLQVAATLTTALSLMLVAGTSASAVSPTTPTTPAIIALAARSAAIPLQPTLSSDAVPVSPMNEPVWTRTCDRGYGLEIWNDNNPENCYGTMAYYYYNVQKYTFNMASFLASQSSRDPYVLIQYLDSWCNTHSFQCNAVWTAISIGASVLLAT